MPQRPLSSFGAQQLNLNQSQYQRSFACHTCSCRLSNPWTYPYSWYWLDTFPASYNPRCEAQAVWRFQHWLLRDWFRYIWPESTAIQCMAILFWLQRLAKVSFFCTGPSCQAWIPACKFIIAYYVLSVWFQSIWTTHIKYYSVLPHTRT